MARSGIEGRTALVTGGAKGIGRAVALRLADKGVKVAVNYKSSADAAAEVAEIITGQGGEAFTVQADIAESKQVKAMMEKVNEAWGHIDVLVNNAGIIDDGLLVRMSDATWDRVMATNLGGTFYCTRAVIRTMLRRRWGRIINIGSVVGIRGNAGQANYAASKAAVIGLAKSLAKEVASRNITVNTVTPGYLETETTSVLTQEQKDYWLSAIPQGHFGDVDDVAHLVAFLADEKAGYITGQVISVDGGMAV